jgi:hypothetical protein
LGGVVAVEVVAAAAVEDCGRRVMEGVWFCPNPAGDLSWVGKNHTRVVLSQPRSSFAREAEACGLGV